MHSKSQKIAQVQVSTTYPQTNISVENLVRYSGDYTNYKTKQGHSLFGCCCDTRRGVIIVNIINIVVTIIGMILAGVSVGVVNTIDPTTVSDDPNIQHKFGQFKAAITAQTVGVVIGIGVVSLLFFSLGIVGALRYKTWTVIVTALWYFAAFVLNIVYLNVVGIVVYLVSIYPHIALAIELKHGIIEEKTYELCEKQSCCCV